MQYYFACFNLEKGTVTPTLLPMRCGFQLPHKNKKRRRTSLRLSLQLAGAVGIEPTTNGFGDRYSTS